MYMRRSVLMTTVGAVYYYKLTENALGPVSVQFGVRIGTEHYFRRLNRSWISMVMYSILEVTDLAYPGAWRANDGVTDNVIAPAFPTRMRKAKRVRDSYLPAANVPANPSKEICKGLGLAANISLRAPLVYPFRFTTTCLSIQRREQRKIPMLTDMDLILHNSLDNLLGRPRGHIQKRVHPKRNSLPVP